MDRPSYLAAGCAAMLLAGCASTPTAEIPDGLRPGANEALLMVVPASGVQIYRCSAAGAAHEWVFVAPQAELFDSGGRAIGWHGAGPQWQANDGSTIVGTVKQRAAAPVAGAIPWLLLGVQASGPPGAFSAVSSIQRVNTAGGAAPAAGCGPASVGHAARVAYTADYRFFRARP